MKLIVHSPVHQNSLQQNLGKPEYSYFFVLKQFLPVLRRLGDVIVVEDAADIDACCERAMQDGTPCLFISCAPPHRAYTARHCPSTTLFAWEFADITTESWDDDPRNDWRNVFAAHGHSICLSTYTAQAVKKAMGADFHVSAIPVPVYEQFRRPLNLDHPLQQSRRLAIVGNVIDTRYYEMDDDQFVYRAPPHYFMHRPWDRQTAFFNFAHREEGSGLLGGFYESEPWGTWSRARAPWIYLPFTLEGKCRITLNATGFGANVNRTVQLEIGDQLMPFTLRDNFTDHVFEVDVGGAANLVRICDLDTTADYRHGDERSLGIGVRWMRIENTDTHRFEPHDAAAPTPVEVELDGIVYTTVLNPADGRKNWEEIITAFCFAFRDRADATLLIKITHHSIAAFLGTLNFYLQRVGPMRCRIVALHGFLDDTQYRALIDATTFYVNASRCEGLCLPLMEFMSAGKPAIAPDHTAMADYVSPASTFIVRSAPEPAIWPQDPRVLLRTYFYRIDWQSLVQGLRDSHALVQRDLRAYQHMGQLAADDIRRCCSDEVVETALRDFMQRVQATTARQPA